MPSEFWSSCPDVASPKKNGHVASCLDALLDGGFLPLSPWSWKPWKPWKPWRSMSNTNDGQQMSSPKSPNFTDTLRLFKVGKLVKHQILQTSVFHPFVISASHSPEETCEKLCPPMLLSNDDVAWLNWEPDIQAAPEPQKTRSWLCLTQWLMLETQWQTPNVATLCHVQQHLLYHITIHYPSLHSNVEKNGGQSTPKWSKQNPLLSFQPSFSQKSCSHHGFSRNSGLTRHGPRTWPAAWLATGASGPSCWGRVP